MNLWKDLEFPWDCLESRARIRLILIGAAIQLMALEVLNASS